MEGSLLQVLPVDVIFEISTDERIIGEINWERLFYWRFHVGPMEGRDIREQYILSMDILTDNSYSVGKILKKLVREGILNIFIQVLEYVLSVVDVKKSEDMYKILLPNTIPLLLGLDYDEDIVLKYFKMTESLVFEHTGLNVIDLYDMDNHLYNGMKLKITQYMISRLPTLPNDDLINLVIFNDFSLTAAISKENLDIIINSNSPILKILKSHLDGDNFIGEKEDVKNLYLYYSAYFYGDEYEHNIFILKGIVERINMRSRDEMFYLHNMMKNSIIYGNTEMEKIIYDGSDRQRVLCVVGFFYHYKLHGHEDNRTFYYFKIVLGMNYMIPDFIDRKQFIKYMNLCYDLYLMDDKILVSDAIKSRDKKYIIRYVNNLLRLGKDVDRLIKYLTNSYYGNNILELLQLSTQRRCNYVLKYIFENFQVEIIKWVSTGPSKHIILRDLLNYSTIELYEQFKKMLDIKDINPSITQPVCDLRFYNTLYIINNFEHLKQLEKKKLHRVLIYLRKIKKFTLSGITSNDPFMSHLLNIKENIKEI